MTTILTFIIPALIVVLLSLPLVNVFKGKVTAKSAKMRLGTHICGFFGAVALVLFLTYANSPVLAAGADKMTGSIAQLLLQLVYLLLVLVLPWLLLLLLQLVHSLKMLKTSVNH